MKEILESIVFNLVEDRSKVTIEEIVDANNILYKVKTAKSDMGRVIGRQGRTAKAIRTIMKSLGSKEKKRVTIEFVD